MKAPTTYCTTKSRASVASWAEDRRCRRRGSSRMAHGVVLCSYRPRITVAKGAALLVLAVSTALGQVATIALGGLFEWHFLQGTATEGHHPVAINIPKWLSLAAFGLFFALLAGLPFIAATTDGQGTL